MSDEKKDGKKPNLFQRIIENVIDWKRRRDWNKQIKECDKNPELMSPDRPSPFTRKRVNFVKFGI